MIKEYLECGFVRNTHGVRGLLRVSHCCDSAEVFCSLKQVYTERGGEYLPYSVKSAAVHGTVILLALEGVDSLDDAVRNKNRTLYARRSDIPLPEGARFIADLIGLPVIDAVTGTRYGILSDVVNRGASDVYEIKTTGGTALMPAVPEFVASIDPERGIFVTPIEGMFNDEV